jgi:ubiquinone/menaquinone biosynthesis C-methylase UbiE
MRDEMNIPAGPAGEAEPVPRRTGQSSSPTEASFRPLPRASIWQRLWRRTVVKRGFYEVMGLILWRQDGTQLLNCGYAEPGYPALALAAAEEAERLGYQLYDRLVRGVALAGKEVAEIGCGRGGGARFLARTTGVRRFTATDASRLLIAANWRRAGPDNLVFRAATAGHLPFAAASCDVMLAVEALHVVPDKAAALAEIARVLRPGGILLIADFFYQRETSANAASRFRAAIRDSGLVLETEEDWTSPALASLSADSARRLAAIESLPRFMRGVALSFASTTHSPLYAQLSNGQARYLHFRLVRGAA